ncbi:hypothetical protein NW249_20780 [Streptomyces sp. OUCMDZ-4982]|uniref:hypothetical protein n=1 Tax=Streptomyces sp. OUCMDZ-4982 TaxID=2973090 RepID=UPI00215C5CF3|nr:hypothetical protein [Streptomyces sp. OUCMDZ-4982]MCR8944557.1 hypothetical protein [Streptomyces sp. OUCMDZ-4982]
MSATRTSSPGTGRSGTGSGRLPALRRAALREWGPLFATVRNGLRERGVRALALTLTAVTLTATVQLIQNQSWGHGPVQALGAVRAEDPVWLALLRTPLSLFVPALDLPVWGALAQILLVFGIAEVCLGRWRTLVVAYVATLAGTLYARVGIALGPDAFLGLPASDAQVVDTGPSAAVVGLAVYVCHARRAWFTGALVIVAMVVEVLIKDNLAGREHLASIAAVLVICAVREWLGRRRAGRDQDLRAGGSGVRSGAPPMRS